MDNLNKLRCICMYALKFLRPDDKIDI